MNTRSQYLTFSLTEDEQDVALLFQSKANRAARRDQDLAKRKQQRDRKLTLQDRRSEFLSTKGQ